MPWNLWIKMEKDGHSHYAYNGLIGASMAD